MWAKREIGTGFQVAKRSTAEKDRSGVLIAGAELH
jgi:hypothetical protein